MGVERVRVFIDGDANPVVVSILDGPLPDDGISPDHQAPLVAELEQCQEDLRHASSERNLLLYYYFAFVVVLFGFIASWLSGESLLERSEVIVWLPLVVCAAIQTALWFAGLLAITLTRLLSDIASRQRSTRRRLNRVRDVLHGTGLSRASVWGLRGDVRPDDVIGPETLSAGHIVYFTMHVYRILMWILVLVAFNFYVPIMTRSEADIGLLVAWIPLLWSAVLVLLFEWTLRVGRVTQQACDSRKNAERRDNLARTEAWKVDRVVLALQEVDQRPPGDTLRLDASGNLLHREESGL